MLFLFKMLFLAFCPFLALWALALPLGTFLPPTDRALLLLPTFFPPVVLYLPCQFLNRLFLSGILCGCYKPVAATAPMGLPRGGRVWREGVLCSGPVKERAKNRGSFYLCKPGRPLKAKIFFNVLNSRAVRILILKKYVFPSEDRMAKYDLKLHCSVVLGPAKISLCSPLLCAL